MNSSITEMYSKVMDSNNLKDNSSAKTSQLAWKSINNSPAALLATPTTAPDLNKMMPTMPQETTPTIPKSVSFSVPEVTSVQPPYCLSEEKGSGKGEESRLKRKNPNRKKKDRLSENGIKSQVSGKAKRRKVNELDSVEDGIKRNLQERTVSGKTPVILLCVHH